GQVVRFNLHAQRLARSKEFLLADEFVECARTHPLGKRLQRRRRFRFWKAGKQAHARSSVRGLCTSGQRRVTGNGRFHVTHAMNSICVAAAERLHKTTRPPRLLHSATRRDARAVCESAHRPNALRPPATPLPRCPPAAQSAGTSRSPTEPRERAPNCLRAR